MSTGSISLDILLNKILTDAISGGNESIRAIQKRYPSLSEKEAHEILAMVSATAQSNDDSAELVVTAPPSFALKTKPTKVTVREMLMGARKSILITGYSLSDYFAELVDCVIQKSQEGVLVKFFVNDIESQKAIDRLCRYKGKFLRIYNYPKQEDKMSALHAKVISVDQTDTLITSANLSYHGQEGNIELGARIHSKELAKQVEDIFTSLVWIYSQLEKQPEKVKDELITFLGSSPMFKAFEADLPVQMGQTIELRDYQQEAIDNLKRMREDGKTIALLYHATGVGKTITAATDAKAVGGRTLFLVNALKLASQAKDTFAKVWPEATLGEYTGSQKDVSQTVIFATVQSISKDLEKFSPTDFDYLIVDECHHAAANTYQKIFTYFHPKFILGLTATPERSDGEDMLELFQNVAHKMDLKTAVERDVLVPIRCIRVKTNIDLTDVRINGIKYNSQDLESKLFIPERNQLIADTYEVQKIIRKDVYWTSLFVRCLQKKRQQTSEEDKTMSNGDYGYFGKGDTGYAQYMTAFNRNFGGSSGGGGGGGNHNNNGGGGGDGSGCGCLIAIAVVVVLILIILGG